MDTKLRRNWIYEVVVETANCHAAPMGVRFPKKDKVVLEVYKTAKTCRNIEEARAYTIYFVDDVLVMKGVLDEGRIKQKEKYTSAEVKVTEVKDLGDRKRFAGKIILGENPEEVKLLNRASMLLLEALIESTKPKPRRKRIEEILKAIVRVAPNSEYERKIRELLR